MGPSIQHTAEKPDGPVTLHVYTGADGRFSLYEDDGTSEQYRRGAYSRIPIRWDERSGTLTIGAREGRWPGMAATRTFNIRWNRPGNGRPLDLDGAPDASVTYTRS